MHVQYPLNINYMQIFKEEKKKEKFFFCPIMIELMI